MVAERAKKRRKLVQTLFKPVDWDHFQKLTSRLRSCEFGLDLTSGLLVIRLESGASCATSVPDMRHAGAKITFVTVIN